MLRATTLSVDDLLTHEALGATATYRVTEVTDELVGVEVLAVPGLTARTRLNITRSAAQAMRCETTRALQPARVRGRGLLSARLRLAR